MLEQQRQQFREQLKQVCEEHQRRIQAALARVAAADGAVVQGGQVEEKTEDYGGDEMHDNEPRYVYVHMTGFCVCVYMTIVIR